MSSHEVRTGSSTWTSTKTGERTWVNRGQEFHPDRSTVTGVGQSRSGKSVEIYHNDGVKEVINKETGRDTFQRTESSRAPNPYSRPTPPNPYIGTNPYSRPTPPSIYRPEPPRVYDRNPYRYDRRDRDRSLDVGLDLGVLALTAYNSYLTSKLYLQEPTYVNNIWTAPVYTPVIYQPEVGMAPYSDLYRNDNSVSSLREMAGAYQLAPQLAYAGISTDRDLLQAARTPEQRAQLTAQTGVNGYALREAVGQADLMRIDGVGPTNSRMLIQAGIRSVQDLARYTWDPNMLVQALQSQAWAQGQPMPSAYDVASWVQQARSLPVAVYDSPYNSML